MSAKDAEAELSIAAARLEAELRSFEEMVERVGKATLDSKKGLERGARALADALGAHERVAAGVKDLVAAVASARERQESAANVLQAGAAKLQERTAVIAGFLEKFGALGDEAREMNAMMQGISAEYREGESPSADMLARINEVHRRMGDVAGKAAELASLAQAEGVVDIGQQADSLRQQIYATRNRLGLLQNGLPSKASPLS
jgi:chromosome segregation ATPase